MHLINVPQLPYFAVIQYAVRDNCALASVRNTKKKKKKFEQHTFLHEVYLSYLAMVILILDAEVA